MDTLDESERAAAARHSATWLAQHRRALREVAERLETVEVLLVTDRREALRQLRGAREVAQVVLGH